MVRVTIRQKKYKGKTYLYEISKGGVPVEVAQNKRQATTKANEIRRYLKKKRK